MPGLRHRKKVREVTHTEHRFALGHLFAWVAEKREEAASACEAAASLQGADSGEAPNEQEM